MLCEGITLQLALLRSGTNVIIVLLFSAIVSRFIRHQVLFDHAAHLTVLALDSFAPIRQCEEAATLSATHMSICTDLHKRNACNLCNVCVHRYVLHQNDYLHAQSCRVAAVPATECKPTITP